MARFLTIHLNARLSPDIRHGYEDFLQEVLGTQAPGSEVTGGSTALSREGEPQSCDIDIDLEGSPQAGLTLVINTLQAFAFGAPKGSAARLTIFKGGGYEFG
jgi:hypothetical protein